MPRAKVKEGAKNEGGEPWHQVIAPKGSTKQCRHSTCLRPHVEDGSKGREKLPAESRV